MLLTRARVPWSQIWTCYCFMMIFIVYDLTCKLYTRIVVRNPRPQSDRNWDNRRGRRWCEDHMCSRSVNALLRYSIKRSTLITSSSLEARLPPAGRTKDVVQVSHCEHVRLNMEHMPMDCLVLGYCFITICKCPTLIVTWVSLIHATPVHPSLCLQYFNPAVYYNHYCCLCYSAAVISLLLLL